MLKYCVEKWDKNSEKLREIIRNDKQINTCVYRYLVELVVKYILNPGEEENSTWDYEGITEIDNGNWQGTLLYFIPKKVYQPCEYEYLMTCVNYGSCSACDALQNIQEQSNNKLSEEQIKDYMLLCKDLVTNIVKPYNIGWMLDERFEHVEMK